MKSLVALLVVGLAALGTSGALVAAAPPAGTAKVEVRAWITPTGQSFDNYAGIDEGTNLPLGIVNGTVSFPLHIGLRHNAVTIDQIRVYVADAAHDGGILGYDSGIHPILTGDATGNREADVAVPVNVGILGSGWKELRFQTRVHKSNVPAGQLSFATTGWQVHVGTASSTYRTLPWTEGRSWWGTNGPYVHARFLSPLPAGPISGTWTFKVSYPDGGGSTTVDTDSHADPMVIGPDLHCTATCTLDTRTLVDGDHWLFLRSDHAISGGTNSAIELIYFTVQNGAPSASPAPSSSPSIAPTDSPVPSFNSPVPSAPDSPAPSVCGP